MPPWIPAAMLWCPNAARQELNALHRFALLLPVALQHYVLLPQQQSAATKARCQCHIPWHGQKQIALLHGRFQEVKHWLLPSPPPMSLHQDCVQRVEKHLRQAQETVAFQANAATISAALLHLWHDVLLTERADLNAHVMDLVDASAWSPSKVALGSKSASTWAPPEFWWLLREAHFRLALFDQSRAPTEPKPLERPPCRQGIWGATTLAFTSGTDRGERSILFLYVFTGL